MDEKSVIKTVPKCKNILGSEMDIFSMFEIYDNYVIKFIWFIISSLALISSRRMIWLMRWKDQSYSLYQVDELYISWWGI